MPLNKETKPIPLLQEKEDWYSSIYLAIDLPNSDVKLIQMFKGTVILEV